MLPKLYVDKGAIRFLFNGADMMSPGITHKNVIELNRNLKLEAGDPVVSGMCVLLCLAVGG